jgi:hypothetical protein
MSDIGKESANTDEPKNHPQPKVREASGYDSRLQCIDRYERHVTSSKNALVANLGAMNCALMRTSAILDSSINESVLGGKLSRDQFREVTDTIDTQLKVTRQVTRFAQLADQIDARDAKKGGPSQK